MFSCSHLRRIVAIAVVAITLGGDQQQMATAASTSTPTATAADSCDSRNATGGGWKTHWNVNTVLVHMEDEVQIPLQLTVDVLSPEMIFRVRSENLDLATSEYINVSSQQFDPATLTWHGNVTVMGIFIGRTHIVVERMNTTSNATRTAHGTACDLEVLVTRRQRPIDHIFTGSLIIMVALLNVNFGAALDVAILKQLLARPIGAALAIVAQSVFMPLASFALGHLIFPRSPELQLGLFFTGVSPSGGASNTWTVVLNGNLNLSILLTTISNLAAFAIMPLWIFTLGQVIFQRANMEIPYARIGSFTAMLIPLSIGIALQRCSPRCARLLVRYLKPISLGLIIFIIVFAIATNLYLFRLFSWQIVVAGIALPWLGYTFAWIVARCARQERADALTIAIETGIQNTGISIAMLKCLPQPQADLTVVVPVAVAIMTPIPLLVLYLGQRFIGSRSGSRVAKDEAVAALTT